jgi:hypothetical protein
MLVNKGHLIASPAAKKDTMPKTVLDVKGKGEQEPKPISSTSTQKKTHCLKEAKLKEAE